MKTREDFIEQAKEVVGPHLHVELSKWAHDAKIILVANALHRAYLQGARDATLGEDSKKL